MSNTRTETILVRDSMRQNLNSLMKQSKVSGKELAQTIGVTNQAVSSWRRGKSSIDMEHVPAICDFFHISADEFLGYEGAHKDIVKDGIPNAILGLSALEMELLECFRSTNETGISTVMAVARAVKRS